MVDAATKKTLAAIPLLKTKAGPRDKEEWPMRLKEEVTSLIKVKLLKLAVFRSRSRTFRITLNLTRSLFQYIQNNKEADNDWLRIQSNKEGTRWFGKCWYIQDYKKYEFELEFDVSTQ